MSSRQRGYDAENGFIKTYEEILFTLLKFQINRFGICKIINDSMGRGRTYRLAALRG